MMLSEKNQTVYHAKFTQSYSLLFTLFNVMDILLSSISILDWMLDMPEVSSSTSDGGEERESVIVILQFPLESFFQSKFGHSWKETEREYKDKEEPGVKACFISFSSAPSSSALITITYVTVWWINSVSLLLLLRLHCMTYIDCTQVGPNKNIERKGRNIRQVCECERMWKNRK